MILIFNYNEEDTSVIRDAVNFVNPGEKILCAKTLNEALDYSISEDIDIFIVSLDGNPRESIKVTGMEFIRWIRNYKPHRFKDIVLTAYKEDITTFRNSGLYVVESLSIPVGFYETVNIIRYLIDKRNNAMNYKNSEYDIAVLKKHNKDEVFIVNNIIFTGIYYGKLNIYTRNNQISIDIRRARNLIDKLLEYGFIQVNRSDYVNPDYIVNFNNKELILSGINQRVCVSKSGMERLAKTFINRHR